MCVRPSGEDSILVLLRGWVVAVRGDSNCSRWQHLERAEVRLSGKKNIFLLYSSGDSTHKKAMDNISNRLEGFTILFGVAEIFGALAVILVTVWLAIMVYRAFPNHSKRSLKLTHAIIHAVAFLLAIIALQAVFDSHNLAPTKIPNLYSLHSWIGLSAIILFACQLLAGLVTFLYPGLKQTFRAAYMPVHVYFGILGFVCAVASSIMGILEKSIFRKEYSSFDSETWLANFLGVVLLIFGSLVVYLVTESRYKRQPRPEDEILLTGNLE
ncbi:Cytochrome b561 [Gryllus bimaculatus]|nr:Cytochrome b561 [Gryllus bimaculatus]